MMARDEQAARDAHALYSLVFPERHLQERLYSIVPFLAKFGPGLIRELYDQVHVECPDHQFVSSEGSLMRSSGYHTPEVSIVDCKLQTRAAIQLSGVHPIQLLPR